MFRARSAKFAFPLKLSEVTQVDSKESPSVQLADVLIAPLPSHVV